MLGSPKPWGPPDLGDSGLSRFSDRGCRIPSRWGRPDHVHRSPVRASVSRSLWMRDEHGAVLPLAMLSLLVLSAVLLGLSLLSGQEPLVARNHTLMAQAQAMAEAGLDRALWALSTPDAADGIPWFAPVPAPYDGSRVVGVAVGGMPLGGFRLT